MLVVALAACQLLSEQRSDPATVAWSGYVFADPFSDPALLLTEGAMTVEDRDGVVLAVGEQPFADTPGYWSVAVAVDQDVQFVIAGPDVATTRFRGHTPTGRGLWFSGALFTWPIPTLQGLLDSLAEGGLTPAWDAVDPTVSHLVGSPLDPDAWRGATVTLEVDGGAVDVLALTATDEGLVSAGPDDPVDQLVAPGVPPGRVTLRAQGPGGAVTEVWTTPGGEVLSTSFLALGSPP